MQLQGQATTWADYSRALKSVEDLGFGSVWTFDHILPFSGPDDRACFETLTTMGAWAALTTRARIGVLVNGVLYRDPVVLAKAAAQVDEITGGRLEFTLGAAWAEREFRAYGWPYPPLAERYARVEEALQLTKLLWSQHRTTFEGRYYHVHDAPCQPKPVQEPHPPVTVGGSGLGSLRIAARHGDRLNMIGSPERCAATIARLERLCADENRDFATLELSAHPNLAIAASRQEAVAIAERTAAWHQQDLEEVRAGWLIGTPDDIAGRMRQYTELGISHFVIGIGHPFDMAPLRLFNTEVLPALR